MLANRTPQFVNPGRERASGDEDNSKSLGAMIKLPIELQASLMVAGKRYAPRLRKAYDNALATQHKDTLERQKLAGMKACRDKEEEYIEALDYLQRFNSNRCWRSKERALEVYNALPSEAARLKAVKEQITIRRKGRGTNGLKMVITTHRENYLITSSMSFCQWKQMSRCQRSLQLISAALLVISIGLER
jgi:hypothetical protein